MDERMPRGVLRSFIVLVVTLCCCSPTLAYTSRPDVLVLCNIYCQSSALYTVLPTDARELELYKLSRDLQPLVAASGGTMLYIANLALTTNPTAALALVNATINTNRHNIGMVIMFSDLIVLDSVLDVLRQSALARSTGPTVSRDDAFDVVVIDDLFSNDGAHRRSTRIDEGLGGMATLRVVRPAIASAVGTRVILVQGFLDVIGYLAGMLALTACDRIVLPLKEAQNVMNISSANVPPSSLVTCHVAVLLQCTSMSMQVLRAGFNEAIRVSNRSKTDILLSGAFLSNNDTTTTVVTTTADDNTTRTVAQRLLQSMATWKRNTAIDVVVGDTILIPLLQTHSFDVISREVNVSAELAASLYTTSTRRTASTTGTVNSTTNSSSSSSYSILTLPLFISVVVNTTLIEMLATTSFQHVASLKPNLTAVVRNFLPMFLVSSASAISAALPSLGRCVYPSGYANASCAVWIARQPTMSTSSYMYVAEIVPTSSSSISSSPPSPSLSSVAGSATGIQLLQQMWNAAVVPVVVGTALSSLSSAEGTTHFDYRLMRWQLDPPLEGTSTSTIHGNVTDLETSIRSVDPLGALPEEYLLNPNVGLLVAEGSTVLILSPDDSLRLDTYGSDFYDQPTAGYRYNLVSNSLDRILVYAQEGDYVYTTLRYLPYSAMEISTTLGTIYLFGGQIENSSAVSRMLSAPIPSGMAVFFSNDTFVNDTSTTMMPSPRFGATLTTSNREQLFVYGGQCNGNVPCEDLWEYNGATRVWTLLYPTTTVTSTTTTSLNISGSPPFTGRYLHTTVFSNIRYTLGGVSDNAWLLVAGGRFTTVLSDIRIFSVTNKIWLALPNPPPDGVDAASLIPCVVRVGSRVVLTVFGTQSTATMLVLNLLDLSWGYFNVESWDVNLGLCASIATYSQSSVSPPAPPFIGGTTSIILGSGVMSQDFPIALQEYTLRDCSAVWTDNRHTSSSGFSCPVCEEGTYSSDAQATQCTACPADVNTQNVPIPWQLPFCYTSDTTQSTTAFALIVFLQVIAVPLVIVFSGAIARSNAWEESEYSVTELCEALAEMMLERVAFLEHLEKPTQLQRAMSMCLSNMKTYRRLIPTGILMMVDYTAWKAKTNEQLKRQKEALSGIGGGQTGGRPSSGRVSGAATPMAGLSRNTDPGSPSSTGPMTRGVATSSVISPGQLALDVREMLIRVPAASRGTSVAAASNTPSNSDLDQDAEGFPRHYADGDPLDDSDNSDALSNDSSSPTDSDDSSSSSSSHSLPSSTNASSSLPRQGTAPATAASSASTIRRRSGVFRAGGGGGGGQQQGEMYAAATATSIPIAEDRATVSSRNEDVAVVGGGNGGAVGAVQFAAVGAAASVPFYVNTSANGGERFSVASSVLQSLQPQLKMRRVSLLWVKVYGFMAWRESFGHNVTSFFKKYNSLMDTVLEVVQEYSGVPEVCFGDAVLATWNSVRPCQQESAAHDALRAAHAVQEHPLIRSMRSLYVASSVATGLARVGIIGGDDSKRRVVMAPMIEECMQLASHCKRLEATTLVEWTPLLQDRMSGTFVFRIVGQANFHRRRKGMPHFLHPPPSERSMQTSLIAELLGLASQTQWQYELKGHREHIEAYNLVVRTIFDGRVEDAKAIPLPRTMPKWYQAELQEMMDRGSLPSIEISA